MRLIDADALKEEVNTKKVVGRFNTLLLIDNAPTVKTFTLADIEEQYRKGLEKGLSEWETERPQGEWIKHIDDIWPEDSTQECPFCHEEERLLTNDNFCPNCGAKLTMI